MSEFKNFKDFQLTEGFTKIKWTSPTESPTLKIEGEVNKEKVILYVDVIEKATSKPEWEFKKEDIAVMFTMYKKDKPDDAITILMDIKDSERLYDRFNAIIKEAHDKKEQKKEKQPPGGGGGGMGGGFGGGMGF